MVAGLLAFMAVRVKAGGFILDKLPTWYGILAATAFCLHFWDKIDNLTRFDGNDAFPSWNLVFSFWIDKFGCYLVGEFSLLCYVLAEFWLVMIACQTLLMCVLGC